MATSGFRHVYGPVPSRRLGRSLGIDLVPYKTCTYDCAYCQLGRTTNKTMNRDLYVPVDEVLAEAAQKLAGPDKPDFVSLAGSGEPTLHSGIGTIVTAIKNMTDAPVAVLTNGSLLWMDEVQDQLSSADVVMPSLDAGDEAMFRHVNRPVDGLSFERMAAGLRSFRESFKGRIWLEVMLLSGLTSIPADAARIAAAARASRPDAIHLNTVTRPPADDWAFSVALPEMESLLELFGPGAEIISESHIGPGANAPDASAAEGEVLAMIGRRPCTADDIASGLGIRLVEALKIIDRVMAGSRADMIVQGGRSFYVAVPDATASRKDR